MKLHVKYAKMDIIYKMENVQKDHKVFNGVQNKMAKHVKNVKKLYYCLRILVINFIVKKCHKILKKNNAINV